MKKKIVVIIAFISLIYSGNALSQPAVGQTAPTLPNLKIIDNNFPNRGNKYLYLDFWTTTSAPEVRSLDHLNSLALRFKPKVIFLAVTDENEQQVRSLLQTKQWNYLYVGLDEDQVYHKKFSVKEPPIFYLISPDNVILASGSSAELMDYKLDSIINKNDSLRLNIPSKYVAPSGKYKMIVRPSAKNKK